MKGYIGRGSVTLFVLLLVASVAGCLGQRGWEYPPPSRGTYLGLTAATPIPVRVAVLPLEDLRGENTQLEYWKVAVPLVPYGVTKYDRPEEAIEPEPVDEIRFDPRHDFARAIMEELQAANIFSSVTFVEENDVGSADLVMRGALRSTQWKRSITTYMLGPFGTVLWIAGMPMGKITTTVDMDLELVEARNPSRALWDFSMEFEGKQVDGAYYRLEDPVLSFPAAVQDALQLAIEDLVRLADEQPETVRP